MPVASASAQTQMSQWGTMTRRYGSFAGKTEVRRTIDGAQSLVLSTYLDSVTLVQDADLNWWIVD